MFGDPLVALSSLENGLSVAVMPLGVPRLQVHGPWEYLKQERRETRGDAYSTLVPRQV